MKRPPLKINIVSLFKIWRLIKKWKKEQTNINLNPKEMNLPKNVYDKKVKSRNLVTTITGLITLIITVLVVIGLLTPEQSEELKVHAVTIVDGIAAVWYAIAAIILMFRAKDS